MTTPGQIVIVSGTSGAGKSTACELFAKRSSDLWLLYGIDHFLAGTFPSAYGHHGPHAAEGIEARPVDPANPGGPLRWHFADNATRAFAAFHEWIAATSRAGVNIVVDHLLMTDPPLLQDCVARLTGLPVLLVSLKPPYEVLAERVASRRMDKKVPTDLLGEDAVAKIVDRLTRLRPWFYEAVYANDLWDLEVDTVEHAPEAVVALIERRLAAGHGAAVEALRHRYVQPA